MVLNLVGTMVEIGSGRRDAVEIDAILAARDRRAAGPTAPARGLFLERVGYDEAPAGRGDAPGADREGR
jgi:tRNA pseudouridine38-40 synthase